MNDTCKRTYIHVYLSIYVYTYTCTILLWKCCFLAAHLTNKIRINFVKNKLVIYFCAPLVQYIYGDERIKLNWMKILLHHLTYRALVLFYSYRLLLFHMGCVIHLSNTSYFGSLLTCAHMCAGRLSSVKFEIWLKYTYIFKVLIKKVVSNMCYATLHLL